MVLAGDGTKIVLKTTALGELRVSQSKSALLYKGWCTVLEGPTVQCKGWGQGNFIVCSMENLFNRAGLLSASQEGHSRNCCFLFVLLNSCTNRLGL